ncbi:MAG: hypothetical protein AB8H86_27285 [Polyangiales bacterium]
MTSFHRLLLFLCTGAAACLPADVDLEGRPCPCVEGYVCEPVSQTCTRSVDGGGEDIARADVRGEDSSIDVGVDVGVDAQPATDSGADVVIMDAGTDAFDAGPEPDAGRDSGPSDTGTDAFDASLPSFCERHGAGSVACLDFDTDPGAEWLQTTTGGATITFDPSRAVSGRSMRAEVGDGADADLSQRVPVGIRGTMWLRTRVYLESASINYMTIVALRQRTSPFAVIKLNLIGGDGRVSASLDRSGMNESQTPVTPIPTNTWTCLEVEVSDGASTNLVSYLNGSEVGRVSVDASGTWDQIEVGGDAANSMQTVWLDDFVWSSSRVPCGLE